MYIFFLIDILSGQMKVHKDVKPVIYVKSAVRGSGSENIRFGIWYVTLFFCPPPFQRKVSCVNLMFCSFILTPGLPLFIPDFRKIS